MQTEPLCCSRFWRASSGAFCAERADDQRCGCMPREGAEKGECYFGSSLRESCFLAACVGDTVEIVAFSMRPDMPYEDNADVRSPPAPKPSTFAPTHSRSRKLA